MVLWFQKIESDGVHSSLCSYGGEDESNQSYLNHNIFALLIMLALMKPLLFNSSLRKFYAPLALVVDITIILRILCVVLFLAYFPYEDNDGNCTETIISKLFYGLIMFGELHQIYVLANLLGLGSYRFVYGKLLNFTLDRILQIVTLLILVIN